MTKQKILIQLDVDPHASVFDAVVAVDAGVDQLMQYQAVEPTEVRELVHGAMFTRGPQDLKGTAIFIGGADVAAAELIMKQVTSSFFGPMRVSVMFDANGANTTAAAAVLVAARHVDLAATTATVLGATGPVGNRAVRLLAQAGAPVRVASRRLERAEAVCEEIGARVKNARLTPYATSTQDEFLRSIDGSQVLIAAGAAGIELVSRQVWDGVPEGTVAIDLNAVPPTGICAINPLDSNVVHDGVVCYGAIGVGGLKMKIHKAAIQALFDANDRVLDAETVFQIGSRLEDQTAL